MCYSSALHGTAWSGAGVMTVGVVTADPVSYWLGLALAIASAIAASGLTLYGRIREERRRQEWLDYELRLKMRDGDGGRQPDCRPDRQAAGDRQL